MTRQSLCYPDEVAAMIRKGENLLLAGDIKLLEKLPKGNWIAGTTPFFIVSPETRVTSYEKIFVTRLPEFVKSARIQSYNKDTIGKIFLDAPVNGITMLIIPYKGDTYTEYALNATNFEGFASHPVCGWLAGRPLDTIMTEPCQAVSGIDCEPSTETAYAMHIEFPDNKYAELHIFNPFKQGGGDTLTFDVDAMVVRDVYVNGKKRNFAQYLRETNFDTNLPFVADYAGAMINVVCCAITEEDVILSAPVFRNAEYRVAVVSDEATEPDLISDDIMFSMTCVGNFIQPHLCAQYLSKMNGPVVYGEIAYQLLNQTTVYITTGDVTA